MEPLEVTAGVISLAAAAVASIKAFTRTVDNIKGAGREILTVLRDVSAFRAVACSFISLIQNPEVILMIGHQGSSIKTIQTLEDPLDNCNRLITELDDKLHRHTSRAQGSRSIPRRTGVKWALYLKEDVMGLQL
jgi:hypothetical protein